MADAAAKIFLPTVSPTSSPTSKVFALINKVTPGNTTSILPGEAEHEFDAIAALLLVITLIVCILFGYYVKVHRIYCLPESAVAMLVGVVLGGITRFINPDNDYDLSILSFSPEIFFFVLLPPIIFEAGYSLNKESFFENFGTITMYAMIGTMISTFFIGVFILLLGKYSIVSTVDSSNLMETMLFGALISAVDPVATLSIMGSPELQCDQLLYSLVFGESVLNDAIAIVLFRTFLKFYSHNNMEGHDIPLALWEFLYVSFLSIVIGTLLGLLASFIYRHSRLNEYPKFETSLLFLFCYGCYAAAEAAQMSGIMALFFNGMVLSHYNSVNLSRAAHVASEHIFSTLATLSETVVFLYMGAGVFSGKFEAFDPLLSICALSACLIGRFCNIFPLSWIANKFRKDDEKVPVKMQFVLWFAGLRGAIAYALAENMPGPNKDTYASTTLCICMFTTIVLGGFTERLLTDMGMKQTSSTADRGNYTSSLQPSSPENFYGLKDKIISFDERIMKPMFGGTMTDGWF
eukprot:CAMPEP_0113319948 /NCGR_PEP_ID=MMETSP0010_2-20120614/13943_1 /TAXON_ID=216773 ORGANISM="Corethron hystrix, Strain 308" /NCGR_SAMPLE_ID=MMETSP0010_2 /ASSEMBLY_ACC=CAM_ASM_000155 /LENGTH=519 /DNA_ID=CAMNT_0000177613 /DNA_START=112 /DNA_END=1668 /DNA_ORIENTATION=+ /assembly_acc=CAM_ASM_000155